MTEEKNATENGGKPQGQKSGGFGTGKKFRGKRKIKILTAAALAAVLLALGAVLLFVKPDFSLNGEEKSVCEIFEKFEDEGASAKYLFFDISDRIERSGDVDTQKVGDYTLEYRLK